MHRQRVGWNELPLPLREAVAARTGPVRSARTVSGGFNSALAVVLDTPGGRVFVKGIRGDHRGVVTQGREALVNAVVRPVAPALLWHLPDVAGWNVLGFECVEGRHADYRPGSADVAAVVAALDALAEVPCPDVPGVKDASRWRLYADGGDTTPFEGDALLHTDWKPDNVLIQTDGTVRVVDWAWPTRGAAWIDPAGLLIQLIANGHTPAQAEAHVACVRAWQQAPVSSVNSFCRANVRLWDEIAGNNPTPWHRSMAGAARSWAQTRLADHASPQQVADHEPARAWGLELSRRGSNTNASAGTGTA
jgi:hypothetical protein